MRFRVGGGIGPLRGGVSVGRKGVGWGGGIGPFSVTGGRGGRRGGNSGVQDPVGVGEESNSWEPRKRWHASAGAIGYGFVGLLFSFVTMVGLGMGDGVVIAGSAFLALFSFVASWVYWDDRKVL